VASDVNHFTTEAISNTRQWSEVSWPTTLTTTPGGARLVHENKTLFHDSVNDEISTFDYMMSCNLTKYVTKLKICIPFVEDIVYDVTI